MPQPPIICCRRKRLILRAMRHSNSVRREPERLFSSMSPELLPCWKSFKNFRQSTVFSVADSIQKTATVSSRMSTLLSLRKSRRQSPDADHRPGRKSCDASVSQKRHCMIFMHPSPGRTTFLLKSWCKVCSSGNPGKPFTARGSCGHR